MKQWVARARHINNQTSGKLFKRKAAQIQSALYQLNLEMQFMCKTYLIQDNKSGSRLLTYLYIRNLFEDVAH